MPALDSLRRSIELTVSQKAGRRAVLFRPWIEAELWPFGERKPLLEIVEIGIVEFNVLKALTVEKDITLN